MTAPDAVSSESTEMRRIGQLRVIAAVTALLVAAIHLLHPSQGGVALVVYANVGYLGDPRPVLFTLGGFALVFGVLLGYQGLDDRRVYLGGICVSLAFLLGFAIWHTVLDHGAFWPYIQPHGHEGNPIVVVALHLIDDPLALASKVLEVVLLATLVVLYRAE
ncbi:MAG: hypothetical protein ACLFNI_00425 [Natronomonas sp.]